MAEIWIENECDVWLENMYDTWVANCWRLKIVMSIFYYEYKIYQNETEEKQQKAM